MWVYSQSQGRLTLNGVYVATGYAGKGPGKNNPKMQDVPNVGPIPRGIYRIGDPFYSQDNGPFCLRLTHDAANHMHGRSGFLIHGDSVKAPGTASEGCIILPRDIRGKIHKSGDRGLEVIE